MKTLTLQEISQNIQTIAVSDNFTDAVVANVEFDSRLVTPNTLFVPMIGTNTDGHVYVDKAIEQGATITFWSRKDLPAPEDRIAVIYVEDTLKAMQELAQYYRQVINPIVIGITGSNGKTTTKDMTAQVLIAKYQVHKTQGNYNNEIGLPYTLLKMTETTEVVVLEMGMSGFGEIDLLSQLAQPDHVAITLIGESHLEFLGSRAGIAQAKLEILSGLKDGGTFLYPGSEPLILQEMPALDKNIVMKSFGFEDSFDVFAYDLIEEQSSTYFRTNLDDKVLCTIPVIGAYNVSNALIALSMADILGVPVEQAIFQLSQFQLTKHRVEWMKALNGAQVLNDAYNASPTSMKAILNTLARLQTQESGRKVAVLGDIRELGKASAQYHRGLAEFLDPEMIQEVYLFGTEMEHLYHELQNKYKSDKLFHVRESHQQLITLLKSQSQPDDIILVKSSLGVDLLKVVSGITGQETHNYLRKS